MNKRCVKPLLLVVSAPSGAGKTTLCERLRASFENMTYSVSCTTRAPRGREVDGQDYHFLSMETFQRYIEEGHFLEYALVHGNYYGTLRSTVREALRAGQHVLLDIDVQGAAQIRSTLQTLHDEDLLKDGFVDIFISPPSLEALRARLKKRGEDSEPVIERRLANAEHELAQAGAYKYRVVNDDVECAAETLREIVRKESGQDE